jgi:SecD/SecF fusion protein
MSKFRCLVAGLLAALAFAGCGSERASGPTCDKPTAAFGEPATRLTLAAPGASAAQLEQARTVLCARLAGLDVAHRVQLAPGTGLTVDVTNASQLADESDPSRIFGVGRLAIYDWEANVVGPRGVPVPGDPEVTGGPDAGQGGGTLSLSEAVRRAARIPADLDADNSYAASRFYAVDPRSGDVFVAQTRAAARAMFPAAKRDRVKVYEVKPGTVVIRAEGIGTGAGSWYVLRDDVALRGSQIVEPHQETAEGPGADDEPVVAFDFTADGREAWARLTRAIADRGSRSVGVLPGQSAADANQHFAVVVDDAIVSIPYIDFRLNPGGIEAGNGSLISGGFTPLSARALAVLLDGEQLPVTLVPTGTSPAP